MAAADAIGSVTGISRASFPEFDPEAPPRDWERQHAAPRGRIILGVDCWNYGAKPVPHLASHHYADSRVKARRPQGNATFYLP
jgi:hypothetical protein